MKNREKILMLIVLMQAAALAGLIFCNKPVASIVASLPPPDYAFVIDDLDEDENADFCANY
jgi:hypothetical protein